MLEIRQQRATYEINHGSLIKCAKNELRNLVVPCFPNARANRQAKLKTKPMKRHKAIVLYGNIVTVTLHGHTPVPEPLKEEHDYYTQDDWTPDKAFGHVFAASHQTCKSKENTKDTCKGVGSHAERLIQPTKVSQVPMYVTAASQKPYAWPPIWNRQKLIKTWRKHKSQKPCATPALPAY